MNRLLTDSEITPYLKENTPSGKVRALLAHQWANFAMAKGFYDALSGVREKRISIDEIEVKIQFNPARIVSSAAKVDAKTISERKCFLCEAHLPVEQRGLAFQEEYLMLCNPFLIFPEHLTIPNLKHIDQRIAGRMGDMLALTKELSDFVIFYNGPKCGASAPDHFHFQAGNKGFLPLETEMKAILNRSICLTEKQGVDIYRAKPFGANALVFKSEDRFQIENAFDLLYPQLEKLQPNEPEPMMNLLSWKEGEQFYLVVFPRRLHRPTQFFAGGETNILLSPASVDLAGVFITPLEKDFLKISAEDLQDILSQIIIDDTDMDCICEAIPHYNHCNPNHSNLQ